MIPAVLYALAIAGAELITAAVNPMGGIIFHTVVLLALLGHASLSSKDPRHDVYLALSLAPLIRILGLSVPLAPFSQIYRYLIITVPLLAATFVIIKMLGYSRSEIALTIGKMRVQLPIQLLVGATGIGFGLIEYYILKPEPLIDALAWQEILLPAFILLVTTGFVEELVFRGVIQRACVKAFGTWGLFYVTIIFTVLHIGYFSVLELAPAFFVGLFFSWVVRKTGSLLGVTLSHGIANITLYLIIPLFFNKG